MRKKVVVWAVLVAAISIDLYWSGPTTWHVAHAIVFVGSVGLVFTIPGLFATAKERAFKRECDGRPLLDDDAFYETFYAGSGMPPDIPARVRKVWVKALGPPWERIVPNDNPIQMYPDLALTDLVVVTEKEFGIVISNHDATQLDGSFDSAVRFVADRLAAHGEQPLATSQPANRRP